MQIASFQGSLGTCISLLHVASVAFLFLVCIYMFLIALSFPSKGHACSQLTLSINLQLTTNQQQQSKETLHTLHGYTNSLLQHADRGCEYIATLHQEDQLVSQYQISALGCSSLCFSMGPCLSMCCLPNPWLCCHCGCFVLVMCLSKWMLSVPMRRVWSMGDQLFHVWTECPTCMQLFQYRNQKIHEVTPYHTVELSKCEESFDAADRIISLKLISALHKVHTDEISYDSYNNYNRTEQTGILAGSSQDSESLVK